MLEGLRIRVKDLDFARGQVIVRGGKGDQDRVTMLPESLQESLRAQLHEVREWHAKDLAAGFGEVWLPGALRAKWLEPINFDPLVRHWPQRHSLRRLH